MAKQKARPDSPRRPAKAGRSADTAASRMEERGPARPSSEPGELIASLGWSQAQAGETRAKLASFAEDWDAPGMEQYDDL